MTALTFPCFIKKTQINPEFSNLAVYQGWDDFRDQSVFVKIYQKFRILLTIHCHFLTYRHFRNSVTVPCFVNLHNFHPSCKYHKYEVKAIIAVLTITSFHKKKTSFRERKASFIRERNAPRFLDQPMLQCGKIDRYLQIFF